MSDETLAEGRWLRLVSRDGWEFVERRRSRGVVVLLAVTEANEIVLVEQFRPAVERTVVELPAGLVGDDPGSAEEEPAEAARRELTEETGYAADELVEIFRGPSSPGCVSEIVTFYRARGLRRVAEGGGIDGEDLDVHHVALAGLTRWLEARQAGGALVDPKIHAALRLAGL